MMVSEISLSQGSENKMQKKMHILITDYHCASNRGDAAILEGIVASLQKYFPNAEITVLTEYPSAARLINNVNSVKQTIVPFRASNVKKNLAILYALIGASFIKRGINLPGMEMILGRLSLDAYINADLVISTGGSFLNDFYAPGNLGRLLGLYFAKKLGKPVVLYAQSIGPLDRAPYRQIAQHVLNKVDLIILRDSRSKKILASMKVNKPPIYVTADAAFAMPLVSPKPMQIWRHEASIPIEKKGLKVSISVRRWPHYLVVNGHKEYVAAIAALADWLIVDRDAQIVFISTCTGFAGYHTDDRVVAHEVIDRMVQCKRKKPVIIYGEYTPQELSAMYGCMDLHIGTRMHSNILAMLAKTPVVAIAYEFKTKELMEAFGLGEYVVDINDIKVDDLKVKVAKALANREQIRNQINTRLPEMRTKAEWSAELIFNLLKEREGRKR